MNSFENVTLRRKRTTSEPNKHNDSIMINTSTLDGTTSSLPEISDDEDTGTIIQLKNRIESLELTLKSAHNEIEKLSLENTGLKHEIENLKMTKELLKRVTYTPVKSKSMTPKGKQGPRLERIQNQPVSGPSLSDTTPTKIPEQRTPFLDTINNISFISNIVKPTQMTFTPDNQQHRRTIIHDNTVQKLKQNKMCILSTDSFNKILPIAYKTVARNTDLCHYLTSHCSINQMLHGLNEKIKGFTMNDYCILLIGNDDFYDTKDYSSIITYIRRVLKDMSHTNIIICAPTYRYGYTTHVFNSRIQLFNNLLNRDILTHKYAYFFDSNYKLKYDYSMFRKHSGMINNYGIRAMFDNLVELIMDIQLYNNRTRTTGVEKHLDKNELQFFL